MVGVHAVRPDAASGACGRSGCPAWTGRAMWGSWGWLCSAGVWGVWCLRDGFSFKPFIFLENGSFRTPSAFPQGKGHPSEDPLAEIAANSSGNLLLFMVLFAISSRRVVACRSRLCTPKLPPPFHATIMTNVMTCWSSLYAPGMLCTISAWAPQRGQHRRHR